MRPASWTSGPVRSTAAPAPLPVPAGSMATELIDEMVAAWRRGEPLPTEVFLDRYPELSTESALRLIHEEVCLRQEAGLKVVTTEVVNRFPRWRAQLELLLDCQRLMQPKQAAGALPEVGESLGEFRLVAELGHGASGPIFLALQDPLAARPVVLKVITSRRRNISPWLVCNT